MVDRAGVAREALEEITRPADVGELVSEVTEDDGTITLLFQAAMPGYPGWHWTVSLAQLPDEEPSVLEAELLPGEGALLAPEWVPWSDRLEVWRAQQAAEAIDPADEDDASDEDFEDDASEEDFEDVTDEDFDDDGIEDDGSDDEDDESDDDDDDFGDDVYDGLDPESAELAVLSAAGLADAGVDQARDTEGDADDDGPEPEAVPAGQ
ncbi:MAG: DUF3027 domain-containing protein [Micrococcales bacterium]|nr:DUF3027 domain-containing protein [Micrococcales bacterium]